MMKHFFEWATKQKLALAAACMMVLAVLVGGSLGAYNRQAFARGVAANTSVETVRFSSNLLQLHKNSDTDPYATRSVVLSKPKEGTDVSFDVMVYNYANENVNLVNQAKITYDFSVEFSGTGDYTVSTASVDNGAAITASDTSTSSGKKTCTIPNQTLNASIPYSHTYHITIPASELDTLNITIKATPDAASLNATNQNILAAVITPGTGNATVGFLATGEFVYDKNSTPKDYDGFNYEVSISSGQATATLTWPDYLEVDKYFLLKIGVKDDDSETGLKKVLEKHTVTFTMNTEDGTGDYLIPIYIKDKSKVPAAWDGEKGLAKAVGFTATQDNSGQTDSGQAAS